MLRGRYTQLFFVLLATVIATVLFRGFASAEVAPGSTENSSEGSVVVTGTDTSNVNVTTTNQSTTTVGSSSDGDSTSPEIVQTSTTTTVENSSISNDAPPSVTQTTQQNEQALISDNQTVGEKNLAQTTSAPAATRTDSGKLMQVNRLEDLVPLATKTESGHSVPLEPPVSTDKNLPAPISTSSGSVLGSSSGNGNGFGGKGLPVAAVGPSLLNTTQVLIIILALLMTAGSSFISYLRRSGYSHAPRSDDSPAAHLSFDTTPRVGMQVVPVRATPAFFVVPFQQLTNQLGRR